MVSWINDHILVLSGWAALAVVFLLPALESAIFLGFVLPGETAVVIGGVLAYQHKVSLVGVLIAAVAGAIVGDSVGFEVGRRWGDALLTRIPAKLIKPVHVAQGKETINRLGGRAVFAGRWVAALRALVPGLCGTSDMEYGTFLTWNALGGLTWATAYTLVGYLTGSAWQRVEHYSSVVSYILLGVVVLIVAAIVVFRRRSQAEKDAETEAEIEEEAEEETEADGSGAGRQSAASSEGESEEADPDGAAAEPAQSATGTD
ncbi:MAG TPA: DedA family protein [Actinocrinis sp.]|nr:DedA family protein [Actinocrinis sp.]